MNLTLSIPNSDAAEFSALPDDVRREVRAYLRAARYVFNNESGICERMKKQALILSVDEKTVQRKLYAYRESGSDWRVFINKAKCPDGAPRLPVEFIDKVWKRLVEENQRKSAPAYRVMIRGIKNREFRFRNGEVLKECPGFEDWPVINGNGVPHGMSYRTLMDKKYQPTRFELAAMREGLGTAIARHVPKILNTRIGLWVMSHVSFDDVLRDFELLHIGKQQLVRPQELGAMDFFSADRFLVQRRPQYRENEHKDNVKEVEMRCLVASWLRNIGYSARGTTCMVELGTATIRGGKEKGEMGPLEEFLYEHSDKSIRVRRAGITGREQALTGYYGRGGGNPRHKALHESHHNLGHNESGNLPAQTGHDRNPPEWLHGLQAFTQGVCKDLATLAPDRAELLMSPHLEYWSGLELLRYIDNLIAHRTDHRIEGWEKCGHTSVEYRLDPEMDDWLSLNRFLALPKATQQMLAAAANADMRFCRARKLSPREVLRKGEGANELIKFPDHIIALMFADDRLGKDLRETKSLTTDNVFSITNQLAGPDRMEFEGFVVTPDGCNVMLQERTDYGVVLNPWDPSALWVYDSKGGFIGTASRRVRLAPDQNPDANLRRLGQREHQIAAMVAPLRERHANVSSDLRLMERNNERVRAGEAVTKEERTRSRAVRRMDESSVEELVEAETLSPEDSDQRTAASSSDELSAEELL